MKASGYPSFRRLRESTTPKEPLWRHVEDEKALVAQIERDGTEFLLSCQWPEKIGHGLVFVSLENEDISEARRRFDQAGVIVRDGWWGYPLMVVEDPDGNQLYFPCEEGGPDEAG